MWSHRQANRIRIRFLYLFLNEISPFSTNEVHREWVLEYEINWNQNKSQKKLSSSMSLPSIGPLEFNWQMHCIFSVNGKLQINNLSADCSRKEEKEIQIQCNSADSTATSNDCVFACDLSALHNSAPAHNLLSAEPQLLYCRSIDGDRWQFGFVINSNWDGEFKTDERRNFPNFTLKTFHSLLFILCVIFHFILFLLFDFDFYFIFLFNFFIGRK